MHNGDKRYTMSVIYKLVAIKTKPMRKKSLIAIALITIFSFTNCSYESVSYFSNENRSCELELFDDSTYKYTFPNFFGPIEEVGQYQKLKNKIVLTWKMENDNDSSSVSYYCTESNSDTLLVRFTNLHDQIIMPKLYLNESGLEFKTNDKGQIKLSYSDLEGKGIIEKGGLIRFLTVIYDNKTYVPDISFCEELSRPDIFDIELNQFIGKKYKYLKRRYKVNADTIFVNDIDRKTLVDRKLVLKK